MRRVSLRARARAARRVLPPLVALAAALAPGPAWAQVDLAVEAVRVDPREARPGERVTVTATLRYLPPPPSLKTGGATGPPIEAEAVFFAGPDPAPFATRRVTLRPGQAATAEASWTPRGPGAVAFRVRLATVTFQGQRIQDPNPANDEASSRPPLLVHAPALAPRTAEPAAPPDLPGARPTPPGPAVPLPPTPGLIGGVVTVAPELDARYSVVLDGPAGVRHTAEVPGPGPQRAYRFEGLPPGDYRLTPEAAPARPAGPPLAGRWVPRRETLTLRPGERREGLRGVDFAFEPFPSVAGRVGAPEPALPGGVRIPPSLPADIRPLMTYLNLLTVNDELMEASVPAGGSAVVRWNLATLPADLPPDRRPHGVYLRVSASPLAAPCSSDVASWGDPPSPDAGYRDGTTGEHRLQLANPFYRAGETYHVQACLWRRDGTHTGDDTNTVAVDYGLLTAAPPAVPGGSLRLSPPDPYRPDLVIRDVLLLRTGPGQVRLLITVVNRIATRERPGPRGSFRYRFTYITASILSRANHDVSRAPWDRSGVTTIDSPSWGQFVAGRNEVTFDGRYAWILTPEFALPGDAPSYVAAVHVNPLDEGNTYPETDLRNNLFIREMPGRAGIAPWRPEALTGGWSSADPFSRVRLLQVWFEDETAASALVHVRYSHLEPPATDPTRRVPSFHLEMEIPGLRDDVRCHGTPGRRVPVRQGTNHVARFFCRYEGSVEGARSAQIAVLLHWGAPTAQGRTVDLPKIWYPGGVPPLPDLAAEITAVEPEGTGPGRVVRYVVRNQGSALARNVRVRMTASDTRVATDDLDYSAPPGWVREFRVPLPAEAWQVVVRVDPDGWVLERDEGNNVAERTFGTRPATSDSGLRGCGRWFREC